MGFYEDDRIRQKNATHEAAWNLYRNLQNEGKKAPGDILEYIEIADPAQGRADAKEIYSIIEKLANRPTGQSN